MHSETNNSRAAIDDTGRVIISDDQLIQAIMANGYSADAAYDYMDELFTSVYETPELVRIIERIRA